MINQMTLKEQILNYCIIPKSAREILTNFGYRDLKNFREKHLNPLLKKGLLQRTNSKLNACNQKYITIK